MYRSNVDDPDILKKHFGLSDLVTPTRKQTFEDSDDDEDDREIGFDPPPEISHDILTNTPVIRLTTPIRQKEPPKKEVIIEDEDLSIPEVKQPESIPTIIPSPRRSPIRSQPTTPVVDISDEDDVNERVMELITDASFKDYEKESPKIQDLCMEAFKIKFGNLKINYPDMKVEFPEGKKLHRVHKMYHSIIKSIYVNMNLDQIQLGYIMLLMGFEFLAIKAFGIPMSGFTKMELKRMYKYQQLMIELGESFYPQGGKGGGPQSSIEWRIMTSFAWNVIIFLGLKFLSKYIGGESMTNVVRSAIDKVLDNPVTIDGIENGYAQQAQQEASGGGGGGLEDMFTGLLGGGGSTGNIAEVLANLGTNFTEKLESKNGKTRPGKKKRVIFNE